MKLHYSSIMSGFAIFCMIFFIFSVLCTADPSPIDSRVQDDKNQTDPKGEKISNDNFIGDVWVNMLVPNDTTFNCMIVNVTFEPGARNNWHTHAGGQILIVTSGTGYYQEEGKPVQVLHNGDAVKILPNVKHWHGATPDSWFSHLAISTNSQSGGSEWFGPVPDEEYFKIN